VFLLGFCAWLAFITKTTTAVREEIGSLGLDFSFLIVYHIITDAIVRILTKSNPKKHAQ